MTDSDQSLIQRRRRLGWSAIGCLILAISGLTFGPRDSAWPAAAMRISIVLGAIWLVLPVKPGHRSLPKLTRSRLVVIVLTAIFINRLKFLLPVLLIAGLAAWIVRPKKRR
jgi:hypothetical protein